MGLNRRANKGVPDGDCQDQGDGSVVKEPKPPEPVETLEDPMKGFVQSEETEGDEGGVRAPIDVEVRAVVGHGREAGNGHQQGVQSKSKEKWKDTADLALEY